ncbi:MAG: PEP-CTERM sorting domain-containing protein [Rugosibacter sp.]|nr:PEP-CTERM sorting domain-containing protein [Rugosibacter sp.]
MMLKQTLIAAALGLMIAAPAAQAAVQAYNFNGSFDSGHFNGESFIGTFQFDDAPLTGIGDEWLSVDSLLMSLLGNSFSLANADALTEVTFSNGQFLGLSYSATTTNIGFSVLPGYASLGESFIAYDTNLGSSGAGDVIYAPIPEPSDWMLMLAGLGLVGFMAARHRKA